MVYGTEPEVWKGLETGLARQRPGPRSLFLQALSSSWEAFGGVSIVPVSETSYRPVKGKGLSKQLIVSAIYTLAPKASRAPSPDPQKE